MHNNTKLIAAIIQNILRGTAISPVLLKLFTFERINIIKAYKIRM